jgi:calcineurin-like phosphoesterase family protein
MNEELIRRYNERVKPEDTCYFLGDLSFGNLTKTSSIVTRLNGTKILVIGNHDKLQRPAYKKMGFFEVRDFCRVFVGNELVYLSHYPYRWGFWKRLYYSLKGNRRVLRYQDRSPVRGKGWILHGHTHFKERASKKAVHVGVDAWNFYPVSEEEVFNEMRKK